jgi:hypothetical protein
MLRGRLFHSSMAVEKKELKYNAVLADIPLVLFEFLKL